MQQYKHANITLSLDYLQPKTITEIPNTTTCKQLSQKTKSNWQLTTFSGSDFGFQVLHSGFQGHDFGFEVLHYGFQAQDFGFQPHTYVFLHLPTK